MALLVLLNVLYPTHPNQSIFVATDLNDDTYMLLKIHPLETLKKSECQMGFEFRGPFVACPESPSFPPTNSSSLETAAHLLFVGEFY